MLIASSSERAFCAGGDVREMADWGRNRMAEARRSLAAEYALNWSLDRFTKPTISLIDGVVMGGGVGITLYGTHRVAGERYRFAMPETGIGLFPDDGVSRVLARLPDEIGMYLALTGRSVGPADAYRLGLATHCIPARRFGEIRAAVCDADPVDPVLDTRHEEPGPGELDAVAPGHRALLLGRQRRGHPGPARRRDGRCCNLGRRRTGRADATLAAVSDGDVPADADGARAGTCAPRSSTTSGWPAASSKARTSTKACGPFWSTGIARRAGGPAACEDVTEAMVDGYFARSGRRRACSWPPDAPLLGFQR